MLQELTKPNFTVANTSEGVAHSCNSNGKAGFLTSLILKFYSLFIDPIGIYSINEYSLRQKKFSVELMKLYFQNQDAIFKLFIKIYSVYHHNFYYENKTIWTQDVKEEIISFVKIIKIEKAILKLQGQELAKEKYKEYFKNPYIKDFDDSLEGNIETALEQHIHIFGSQEDEENLQQELKLSARYFGNRYKEIGLLLMQFNDDLSNEWSLGNGFNYKYMLYAMENYAKTLLETKVILPLEILMFIVSNMNCWNGEKHAILSSNSHNLKQLGLDVGEIQLYKAQEFYKEHLIDQSVSEAYMLCHSSTMYENFQRYNISAEFDKYPNVLFENAYETDGLYNYYLENYEYNTME